MSKVYIIGVSDGHGVETTYKSSPDDYLENEFNHYTKEFLKEELKRNGFKIVDVSPERSDTPLANRAEREKKGNCDCFISIHYNAIGKVWQKVARGIETYYHTGSEKGKKLAELVHNELLKGSETVDRKVKKDTVLYDSGLYMLRCTRSPAILVECGFMDNKLDRFLMESTEYRKECAREICQGICNYFNKKYKPEPKKTIDINEQVVTNKRTVPDIKKFSLDDVIKIISPNYHKVWLKHFKSSSKLNWEGLLKEALLNNKFIE